MRHFLIIMFLCFTGVEAQQSLATIKGRVFEESTKQAVPYASIVVKSKKDNNIITGGITQDDGGFKISNIPYDSYRLEVQFIGYETLSQDIVISNKATSIGTLFIKESAESLQEVTVIAERSTIEQKIDRKVINVGKDLTTTGASASDIMGNIPSVSVNQDGEITLRGNENVRILVDGKPTNMDSTQLLQQIPSTSIKTIELITNPSAKYNPEGMSGIINIVLRKNTNLGFNGNVSTGTTLAQETRFNNTLDFNYRTGKVNLYTNYGNRLGEQITDGSVTRIPYSNQLTKNINQRTSHLVKLGIDYFINDRNTVSLYTNQNFYNGDFDGKKTISFFEDEATNFIQDDFIERDNITRTYNIDYKLSFKDPRHYLEFEADYNHLDSDVNNTFIFTEQAPLSNYNEAIVDERYNTTLNLDYAYPTNENSLIELGLETRVRRTNVSYDSNRIDLLPSRFIYDRDIHSGYITWSQTLSRWHYQLGVRLEDFSVDANFNQEASDPSLVAIDLFNVFPSGFLKYILDDNNDNSLQLSFSRRIDRPSLNQINPIRRVSTPQIVILGNPALNPQFTSSVEINYNKKLKKGNFTAGIFYRAIKDEINRIGYFDENDPNLLILDYANFDNNKAYGVEISAAIKPLTWWNINSSFDVYTREQKGIIESEKVAVNNTLLNFKMNNNFKVSPKITLQLFGTYTGKQKILQYERKDNYYINLGARYNFANGNGAASLNFNDVFSTQRFAFESYRTIIQEGEFLSDTHSLYLGLSYRFGSGKNNPLKRKKRDNNIKRDRIL